MVDIEKLLEESERLRSHTHADTTLRDYGFDWRNFISWCAGVTRQYLPASPETVTLYLTDLLMCGKKLPTCCRRAAAINHFHRQARYPPPADIDARTLLRGARRLSEHHPVQKRALTIEHLREICALSWNQDARKSIRNHAILTLGFASALRRSNLVTLAVADARFVPEGLILRVHREKNDQEGKGRFIGIVRGESLETCAVRALERWLAIRGDFPGPLFIPLRQPARRVHPEMIAKVVKAAVKSIGLDGAYYAAHSLRSGFVTAAILGGAGELIVAKQTGHRSLDSLRLYFRATDLFRRNASSMVGM